MKVTPEILTIKSDKKELNKVDKFLSRIFVKNNLPFSRYNRVLLCVSEAVVNSIEHGNRNDLDKQVSIGIDCKKEKIFLEIRDQGEGFDYTNIEDPTKRKNVKKEFGRGIHIIKNFCEEMEFNERGNCVYLKIDVSE